MKKFSQIFSEIESSRKTAEFIPSGFPKLDMFLDGGFLKKELVVIGAPTGKGKSYLASHLFLSAAMSGFRSAYFSLEISNEMVVSRIVGTLSNIKPTRITHGMLTKEEFEAKKDARISLSAYEEFMSFYDDLYEFSEIVEEIEKNKFEFIVVDFIQNVVDRRVPDEYSRLSFVTRDLQKLAKETDSCICILSQLSNVMARENRSGIVEYRGSGGIGIAADLGFFIETSEDENSDESFVLKLRKNRRGISGASFSFHFEQPGGLITQI